MRPVRDVFENRVQPSSYVKGSSFEARGRVNSRVVGELLRMSEWVEECSFFAYICLIFDFNGKWAETVEKRNWETVESA